jgi:hypothetical protein
VARVDAQIRKQTILGGYPWEHFGVVPFAPSSPDRLVPWLRKYARMPVQGKTDFKSFSNRCQHMFDNLLVSLLAKLSF